ncbi:agamous-like MADS-box protein AGL80 [Capsicum chacoense]
MGRKKVKLDIIENITKRKVSYKKRQKGLIKKAFELKTLCNVEMAVIIYSPYHIEPKLFPNNDDAIETFSKFRELPEFVQSKNMVTQKKFTEEMKEKIEEKIRKIRKENRVKEFTNKMYEMLNGNNSQFGMNRSELNDLCYVINENLKQVCEMIKKKADGESSIPYSQQPTSGLMVTGMSISEGPRAPSLSHDGNSVLVLPMVDPPMIPSGINFERPRFPELVSNVTSIAMIPPETSSIVPLAYPSQVPQPPINPSMSNPLLDASIPMNINQNYSSGFPMSPSLSQMLDWNDDVITLLGDPYFNNITFQDPSNNNNNF